METKFTCYTRMIEGQMFYFVKKFLIFPEFHTVSPVMDALGMHTNFDKACAIVHLTDSVIKKQLLEEVETGNKQAKIIDLAEAKFNIQKPAVGL